MLAKEIMEALDIRELLCTGTRHLQMCDVPEARAEADLILAHILDVTRDRLYIARDIQVTGSQREKYYDLVTRRGRREPLAYLLKVREFMGLDFYVDHRVLIPRPETELLVEKTVELGKTIEESPKYRPVRILDLCTGSGAIAVSVAHCWPNAVVTATDISRDALAVARYNAERINAVVEFRQGDLFQAVSGETFDIIVSNPPYVSDADWQVCSPEVRREPVQALIAGNDGLDFYRRIARDAGAHLSPQGVLLVEIGYDQGISVKTLFASEGYRTVIFQDYAGLDRIVIARKE
ncbi:peptide chain release factor N(5)-glutamine methyltransferase [Dehalobacter sp. DCM]|uniref:peptide chain release factor N(5)-glutamine methyltransferase n=1 Tax=Dehalobacter sp. DCM TaxID=2907827 RepID=UPI003081A7FD|nr:peptide chain release factor N(5)-glutamine methyltransferase [Dehalobacter sp. DCM]